MVHLMSINYLWLLIADQDFCVGCTCVTLVIISRRFPFLFFSHLETLEIDCKKPRVVLK